MICHGMTASMRQPAFPLDEGLDEQGLRQVAAAAPLFAGAAPSRTGDRAVAVCGPALRCRQTAAGLGLAAEADDDLRDWDAGRWAGRTLTAVQAEDPEGLRAWSADPTAAPHGGESLLTLIARTAAWLRALGDAGYETPPRPGRTPHEGGRRIAESGGKLVAITHPAVIRAAVVHVLGAPPEAFWTLDAEPLSHISLTLRGGHHRLRFAAPPPVPQVS